MLLTSEDHHRQLRRQPRDKHLLYFLLCVKTYSCWCHWPPQQFPLAVGGCRRAALSCLPLCICQPEALPSSPSQSRKCSRRTRPGRTGGRARSSAPPVGGGTAVIKNPDEHRKSQPHKKNKKIQLLLHNSHHHHYQQQQQKPDKVLNSMTVSLT